MGNKKTTANVIEDYREQIRCLKAEILNSNNLHSDGEIDLLQRNAQRREYGEQLEKRNKGFEALVKSYLGKSPQNVKVVTEYWELRGENEARKLNETNYKKCIEVLKAKVKELESQINKRSAEDQRESNMLAAGAASIMADLRESPITVEEILSDDEDLLDRHYAGLCLTRKEAQRLKNISLSTLADKMIKPKETPYDDHIKIIKLEKEIDNLKANSARNCSTCRKADRCYEQNPGVNQKTQTFSCWEPKQKMSMADAYVKQYVDSGRCARDRMAEPMYYSPELPTEVEYLLKKAGAKLKEFVGKK